MWLFNIELILLKWYRLLFFAFLFRKSYKRINDFSIIFLFVSQSLSIKCFDLRFEFLFIAIKCKFRIFYVRKRFFVSFFIIWKYQQQHSIEMIFLLTRNGFIDKEQKNTKQRKQEIVQKPYNNNDKNELWSFSQKNKVLIVFYI